MACHGFGFCVLSHFNGITIYLMLNIINKMEIDLKKSVFYWLKVDGSCIRWVNAVHRLNGLTCFVWRLSALTAAHLIRSSFATMCVWDPVNSHWCILEMMFSEWERWEENMFVSKLVNKNTSWSDKDSSAVLHWVIICLNDEAVEGFWKTVCTGTLLTTNVTL